VGYENMGRIQLTHEVNHRFFAAEDVVHFQAIPCAIYDGQNATG
jgi:hypothetical protein